MILNLSEVKDFLRIEQECTDEDTLLNTLIAGSEEYLKNATGCVFDSSNPLAKLFCQVLIVDWYENREFVGKVSDKVRYTVQSMLIQLKYSYGGTT